MRLIVALACAAAVTGCGEPATNNSADAAPPPANVAAPITPSPLPAPASAPAPAAGCADGLAAEIDLDQYMGPLGPDAARPGTAALDALAQGVQGRVRTEAARLCAEGVIPAARFAPLRRLLIRNAAGADSVAVYADPAAGADALVLEYAFSEPVAPEAADIATGLTCWAAPDRPVCADRMP